MSLPDAALLEGFSVAELRAVVGALVAEIGALRSSTEAQQAMISVLRAENQALRDEVARLKGLPPRPPSRPSGMEQAMQPGAADQDAKRPKSPRGVKRAWFEKCQFQVTPEIDRALMVKGFLVLGVTLI